MKNYLNIFKAISDENRLRILMLLKIRPLCVCEIYSALNIALSTISAHLKLMKQYSLIEDEKDGRWVIYRLVKDNEFFTNLIDKLEDELHDEEKILQDRKVISNLTREICVLKLKEKQQNILKKIT